MNEEALKLTLSSSPQMCILFSRSRTLTPSSDSIMLRFRSNEPNTLITCSILSTSIVLSIIVCLLGNILCALSAQRDRHDIIGLGHGILR